MRGNGKMGIIVNQCDTQVIKFIVMVRQVDAVPRLRPGGF